MIKKILISTLVFCMMSFSVNAQDTIKTKKEIRKEKKEAKKKEPPHKGSFYITPLPVIGQNPAWGFMYGAAVSTSWFMGDPSSTKISSMLLGFTFTSKKQFLGTLKGTTYFADNEWKLDVDWRFLNTSQPTF